ncbi:hypothetical protein ACFOQM_18525 [Paenibacillus sp. GCM10012307]|uniref:Aldolase n=1 Tax=Paenibacillus roseus TaxID=2798579 RepID=A0A934MRT7_9BACL|nr:hypothetical protein [Paenibacillus roseus]MBJ6363218.1 hypothetical protein [Paenibacillus roseus]
MSFLHSKLSFYIEEPLSLDSVFDFFNTHFDIQHGANDDVLASITVTKSTDSFKDIDFSAGEDVYLRKSASEFFTIRAKCVVSNEVQYLKCLKTNTYIAMNKHDGTILIASPGENPQAEELVFIELIRDLVLKNEENHGVVVLHATCAYKDERATLIIGPKGAGKSTTLLEIVSKFGYQFMSGDKTFLWVENGQLYASGWPDYPHLGLGTLSKYPEFIGKLNLSEDIHAAQESLWSTDHKRAIPPDIFKTIFASVPAGFTCLVGGFLYPKLEPAPASELAHLNDHVASMLPHIERIFGENGDAVLWNNYIVPQDLLGINRMIDECKKAASRLPAFTIRGSGILTNLDALNEGVPSHD